MTAGHTHRWLMMLLILLMSMNLAGATTYHIGVLSHTDDAQRDPAISVAIEDFLAEDVFPGLNIT